MIFTFHTFDFDKVFPQYVLDWDDGAVRIAAGLMIKGLGVPFSGEASVRDIKVNPDVKTRVDNVGVDFGIQVRLR